MHKGRLPLRFHLLLPVYRMPVIPLSAAPSAQCSQTLFPFKRHAREENSVFHFRVDQLSTLLRLHLRPIKLAVFQEACFLKEMTNLILRRGFMLRYFPRLSLSYIATQQGPSKYGRNTPVYTTHIVEDHNSNSRGDGDYPLSASNSHFSTSSYAFTYPSHKHAACSAPLGIAGGRFPSRIGCSLHSISFFARRNAFFLHSAHK